jgi:hypothetical protein
VKVKQLAASGVETRKYRLAKMRGVAIGTAEIGTFEGNTIIPQYREYFRVIARENMQA